MTGKTDPKSELFMQDFYLISPDLISIPTALKLLLLLPHTQT